MANLVFSRGAGDTGQLTPLIARRKDNDSVGSIAFMVMQRKLFARKGVDINLLINDAMSITSEV